VSDEPVLINEVAANFESWDAYKKKIEFHVGPSGFSLATIATAERNRTVAHHRCNRVCHGTLRWLISVSLDPMARSSPTPDEMITDAHR
jgi:hypothetical protein